MVNRASAFGARTNVFTEEALRKLWPSKVRELAPWIDGLTDTERQVLTTLATSWTGTVAELLATVKASTLT
jgi:hypothetical protein